MQTTFNQIVNTIIPPQIVGFMNTNLLSQTWIFVDYWSFVHVMLGILFFRFVSKDLKVWIAVMIIFEVVEFVLATGGNPLFVERFIDTVWDVIFGIIGFKIAEKIKINKYKMVNKITKFLKLQKEGAVLGFMIAAFFYIQMRFSLIENLTAFLGIPLQPEWLRIVLMLTVGILVGGLIDSIYKPKK